MRTSAIFSALFLASSAAFAAEAPKTMMKVIPLDIAAEWSVPWEEVSGITLFQDEVYIASDSSMDIGRIPWRLSEKGAKRLEVSAGEKRKLTLETLTAEGQKPKKKKKKTKKSQWEAIAVDSGGSLFVLKETKDEIHSYGKDGQTGVILSLKPFDGRKSREKGFEGIVLLKSSHILVALTSPPVLIEYGPKDDKALGLNAKTLLGPQDGFTPPTTKDLYPLHSWKLTHESGCEFSDLTVSKEAKVFALMKDCGRIIQLPELSAGSQEVASIQSWSVPAAVPHPEGLEALGDEGFLVASDVRAIEKNLFWLKPSVTAP